MRIRVRYSKTGKLRYVSAIDLGRIWERALRRADLPIAYSEGFSPHPKVSFPDALPLGYASRAEYAELLFAGPIDLPAAISRLNASLPDGMAVLDASEVADGASRLSKWLRASLWALDYPPEAVPALDAAVPALLASHRAPVDRDRKGEITEADLRPAIHQLALRRATVLVVLHHTEPPMRPSEVHQGLRTAAAASADLPLADLVRATRLAQGEPTSEGLREALSGETHSPRQPHDIEEGQHERAQHI